MKKVIIAIVLLFSVTVGYSQLNFGIKAGYTSSLGMNNLGSLTSGDYTMKSVTAELNNNFHAGVFARVFFGKVYVQPELLYAMSNTNYKMTMQDALSNSITYDKFVAISTVDVPLLLGYKVLDLKVANLRVFAGPKLRFNAGSSLEFKNLTGGITQGDLVNDIKSSQIGLEAGAGVDVLMFALDFRYNLIGDMYQTKINNQTFDNIPVSNFVISLGWKLF